MPSTRRAVLGAVAGALGAGLAGCSALTGGTASSSRAVPPAGERITDYDTARHVVDGEERLFHWSGDDDRSSERLFLATPADRERVTFDRSDGPVATVVAETDLSRRSLVLLQGRHTACHRLDVMGVTKRPDTVRVQLCRESRPADVACAVEDRQSTALALRLPLDGRSLSEGLQVTRSSRCTDRYGPSREGDR